MKMVDPKCLSFPKEIGNPQSFNLHLYNNLAPLTL